MFTPITSILIENNGTSPTPPLSSIFFDFENSTATTANDSASNFSMTTMMTMQERRQYPLGTFEIVMQVIKMFQLFIGVFGNAFSLIVLLLYRHFLSHPFWFYLVALCTVDLIGSSANLIEIEFSPFDFYHEKLFKNGHVNLQLEAWLLHMVHDLSAWLIVFIAIERWKSVCWNSDRLCHHQNHNQWSPPRRSTQQVSAAQSPQLGILGFASFKRRTAQLETFFIVTGGLMIINAINYFANENLFGSPEGVNQAIAAGILNSTTLNNTGFDSSGNRSMMPYQQSQRASSTESYLATQWSSAWPFVKEIKQCWLPAIILLVLNCWIVVHTIRFLWYSPPLPLIRGRRFGFRRLTSTSISSPTQAQTATTTLAGSTSPLTNPAPPVQIPLVQPPPAQNPAAKQASIVYHRSQSMRRRRLVFAWLTLLALPTVFIAFTLPLSVYNILDIFIKNTPDKAAYILYLIRDEIVHRLSDCNHTVNCFIYCLTIAKFRMAIARMFRGFTGTILKCVAILTKKSTHQDAERCEQQCQLVSFIERARQIRQCRKAKKRRFVVGVVENVEAISDFQNQRHLAAVAHLGIRRASGMESGIAFDGNAHFYD